MKYHILYFILSKTYVMGVLISITPTNPNLNIFVATIFFKKKVSMVFKTHRYAEKLSLSHILPYVAKLRKVYST